MPPVAVRSGNYDTRPNRLYTMRPTPDRKPFWVPHTNIFIAQSGELMIQLDLTGLQRRDFELTPQGDKLIIKGQRHRSEVAAAKTFLVNEIPAGPFECVLDLPPGFDLSRVVVDYSNGLLCVSVPSALPPSASSPNFRPN